MVASLKKEGMASSYDNPSIAPWKAYIPEFEDFYKSLPFYYRIFGKPTLRKIWDEALFVNAQETKHV